MVGTQDRGVVAFGERFQTPNTIEYSWESESSGN